MIGAILSIFILGVLGALAGGVGGFICGALFAAFGVVVGVLIRLFFREIGQQSKWLTGIISAILAPAIFLAFIFLIFNDSTSDGSTIFLGYVVVYGAPVLAVIAGISGASNWGDRKYSWDD